MSIYKITAIRNNQAAIPETFEDEVNSLEYPGLTGEVVNNLIEHDWHSIRVTRVGHEFSLFEHQLRQYLQSRAKKNAN